MEKNRHYFDSMFSQTSTKTKMIILAFNKSRICLNNQTSKLFLDIFTTIQQFEGSGPYYSIY